MFFRVTQTYICGLSTSFLLDWIRYGGSLNICGPCLSAIPPMIHLPWGLVRWINSTSPIFHFSSNSILWRLNYCIIFFLFVTPTDGISSVSKEWYGALLSITASDGPVKFFVKNIFYHFENVWWFIFSWQAPVFLDMNKDRAFWTKPHELPHMKPVVLSPLTIGMRIDPLQSFSKLWPILTYVDRKPVPFISFHENFAVTEKSVIKSDLFIKLLYLKVKTHFH